MSHRKRGIVSLKDMKALRPIITLPRPDPDILCPCGKPALLATTDGTDLCGWCPGCLPGYDTRMIAASFKGAVRGNG